MNTLENRLKSWLALNLLRFLSFVCANLLIAMIGSIAWADSHFQVDWEPNKYRMVCQDSGGCRLSEATYRKVESMMTDAVSALKGMGFRAPLGFGNRVGEGTADDFIELYERADKINEQGKEEKADGIAGASCYDHTGKITAKIKFGNNLGDHTDRDYLVHFILAHEYAHIIQYYYPFRSSTSCKPSVPGWVAEGLATALGLESMRKRYFSTEPKAKNDREARLFSGLRRYDITLADRRIIESEHGFTEAWTGAHYQYRTSSFWRHLANVYYEGKYDFVGKYMDLEVVDGDWLGWLWNNIRLDTDENLSMVHAGFLADFAGWSKKGFPGQFYNRIQWLKKSFGGCQTIYLNKTEASDYVDVDIEPLGGKCIIVSVGALGESGIAADESATVQVAATVMSGSSEARDGLHLGLAASNDKKSFHCAAEVKRDRKKGVGRCLRIPDDGKVRINGGEVDARVWNVFPQEKGKGGDIVNLYTVSYTPALLTSFQNLYVTGPISARFYFVLDWAKLQMNDHKTASTGKKKKGAVAHLAEGADPQTTLPKQDERGMPANSYSLPESLRPSIPVTPPGSIGQATGKLGQLVVSQGQAASVVLVPGKLSVNGKLEPQPLNVGDTGEFPMGILSGSLNGEPLVALGPGSLVVEEFTDLVFRASYSGTMCRLKELMGKKMECPNPIPISGQIVKAFVGTRLPGRHMKIERTPGTEMYRKANEKGMAAWSTGIAAPSTPGAGTSASGSSTSSGGSIPDCACSCEEREAIEMAGREMKRREAAGEKLEVSDIMGLNRCTSTCQREYMICAMEQGDRERAVKKEKRKRELAESAKDCDCSCAALRGLESKTATIMGQLQSGDQAAMDEMRKMGACMSVCQDSLMRCARSGK